MFTFTELSLVMVKVWFRQGEEDELAEDQTPAESQWLEPFVCCGRYERGGSGFAE
jgi:hypothetical protein